MKGLTLGLTSPVANYREYKVVPGEIEHLPKRAVKSVQSMEVAWKSRKSPRSMGAAAVPKSVPKGHKEGENSEPFEGDGWRGASMILGLPAGSVPNCVEASRRLCDSSPRLRIVRALRETLAAGRALPKASELSAIGPCFLSKRR